MLRAAGISLVPGILTLGVSSVIILATAADLTLIGHGPIAALMKREAGEPER